jgi:hypothetical protein
MNPAPDYRARREVLLEWLRERGPETANGIATGSLIYQDGMEYRFDLLRSDLRALEKQGKVWRLPGRPARWQHWLAEREEEGS